MHGLRGAFYLILFLHKNIWSFFNCFMFKPTNINFRPHVCILSVSYPIYRVSQKKRNGGFSVHCELKVLFIFTSLDGASSAEENDALIIQFGWVILILWPFLEIRSFSNFAGFLRRISGELWRDKPSIQCFCGSPLIRGNKRNMEQWASTGRRMDCLSRQNSSLIRPKNPAKFENDRISWNDHRIKITQPNLKI